MKFIVVTIFPEFFTSALAASLLGKAIEKGLIEVQFVNPRTFTEDVHNTVDDVPFGGGAGMVMMPEPLVRTLESISAGGRPELSIAMSPRGQLFDQQLAHRLSKLGSVLLLCGRYEGMDQRVLDGPWIDMELSIGDFVLAGGEAAALTVIEATTRLVPGVLGNEASLGEESHSAGRLEYPQYTRPRSFRGMEVPEILLSGHHAKIAEWRRTQSLVLTRNRRPDLLERHPLTGEEQKLLDNSR